jgi:hypothetical protein
MKPCCQLFDYERWWLFWGNIIVAGWSVECDYHELVGQVVLCNTMIESGKLSKNTATYFESATVRGVEGFSKRPNVQQGMVEEFQSMCAGSFYGEKMADYLTNYAGTKYLVALWVGAMAQKHPKLHILTISPGNTLGRQAYN